MQIFLGLRQLLQANLLEFQLHQVQTRLLIKQLAEQATRLLLEKRTFQFPIILPKTLLRQLMVLSRKLQIVPVNF